MLRLHGFPSSNYYNIAKLTLIEKGIEFEEVVVYSGAGERYRPDYLDMSPQGKVPCLETDRGFLTESRAIVGYLEDIHPEPPLYPADAFGKAKVVELTLVIDLYFELAARRVLRNFLTQTKPPDSVAREAREVLERASQTITRLSSIEEYVMGARFTAADVSAIIHFPVVRAIARQVLDVDPVAAIPGATEYLRRMGERKTVKQVRAAQQEDLPKFMAHLQKLYASG